MADAVQDEMVYKLELLNDFRAWLRRRYPLMVKRLPISPTLE